MGIGFSENGAAFGKKRIGIESKSAIFCKSNGFIKIDEKTASLRTWEFLVKQFFVLCILKIFSNNCFCFFNEMIAYRI